MRKLWLLIYYSIIPAIFYFDFYNEPNFLKKIGGLEVVSNVILIFYYITSKKSKFISNDWLLIEALLFTCASGLLLLLFRDTELLMFTNTVGFYLTQFMYISIFRKEGSILPAFSSAYKAWKMIILTIVFLVGLLFVLVQYIPNSLLVISFVYSTQMIVLCWMAYFRPIEQRAFIMGFVGVFLLVISNFWLTLNLLYQQFPYQTGIYFMIYFSSQLLIVESVLVNRNQTIQD
jgi:YhhN family